MLELTDREFLVNCYQAAVDAVDGRQLTRQWLKNNPSRFDYCVALGKAAPSMMLGLRDVQNDIKKSLIVSSHSKVPKELEQLSDIQFMQGTHPVPDELSIQAATQLLSFLSSLEQGARVLFLISGGTSSLVELPYGSISLEKLQEIYRYLLASGKDIHAMNAWRKQFSQIKGGKLAEYVQHLECTQLLISDVRGDDPAIIGSGLLAHADLKHDNDEWLGEFIPDHPQPVIHTSHIETHIIGNLDVAKRAAQSEAEAMGVDCYVYDEFLEGEAITQGERIGQWLKTAKPGCHIWGGETIVNLPDNPGMGGRNQSFALSVAKAIDGENISLLAAGTDGVDGNTACAGGVVSGMSCDQIRQTGYNIEHELKAANAGTVLMSVDNLLKTGPSGTNVMDIVIAYKK